MDDSYILGPFKVSKEKVKLGSITMVKGEKAVRAFVHGYRLGLDHKAREIKNVLEC